MEIYLAKVLDGKAAAKQYGVSDRAQYLMAPSGKLFRGFTQKILEVIPFGGIRFFNIEEDLEGVCEVPAELLKAALGGDETLAAVQKKLASHARGLKKKAPADNADGGSDKSGTPSDPPKEPKQPGK